MLEIITFFKIIRSVGCEDYKRIITRNDAKGRILLVCLRSGKGRQSYVRVTGMYKIRWNGNVVEGSSTMIIWT